MFELKKLTPAGIERAMAKVERYRLLNEPEEAESICRDVLDIEPGHQQALVSLLLSLTDQFGADGRSAVEEATEIVERLQGEYERAYYAGIVAERRATAYLERGALGSGQVAYPWYVKAMQHYEEAERLRPPGNDDALVRWNTCARRIMRRDDLRPPQPYRESQLE